MIRSGAVRSGAVRSGAVKAGNAYGAVTNFHDGISYSASSGLVTIKAPGAAPVTSALTSAFTFTGGNQSMYRGANGLLLQSVTNTPREKFIELCQKTFKDDEDTREQEIHREEKSLHEVRDVLKRYLELVPA